MRHFCTSIVAMLMLAGTSFAADIYVPGDHATIQDAIDASSNGDRVFVAPGTWTGIGTSVIDFRGKEISVRSTGTATDTVLDGEGIRPVVLMTSGETASTSLEGFTVTRGLGTTGGGILIQDGSPMILNCTIRSNAATGHGGGIAVISGNAVIRDCLIHQNSSGDWGGGLYLQYGTHVIETTTLSSNTAINGGGGFQLEVDAANWDTCTFTSNHAEIGGGVFHLHHADPSAESTFRSCIFNENHADYYGGGIGLEWGSLDIINCQIIDNTAAVLGGGVYLHQTLTDVWNTTVCGNTPEQFNHNLSDTTFHSFAFVGPECPTPSGPCCLLGCTATSEVDCLALGGTWLGEGGSCDDCPASCAGDTDGNGIVDIEDLLNMMGNWGACP
jgi:hypothetical protein